MATKMKMVKCSECGEIENWLPEDSDYTCSYCHKRAKFAADAAARATARAAEEAQTPPAPYVEDTSNADRAREVAREMVYDADLARQQTGPDPIEIKSHWYMNEDE